MPPVKNKRHFSQLSQSEISSLNLLNGMSNKDLLKYQKGIDELLLDMTELYYSGYEKAGAGSGVLNGAEVDKVKSIIEKNREILYPIIKRYIQNESERQNPQANIRIALSNWAKGSYDFWEEEFEEFISPSTRQILFGSGDVNSQLLNKYQFSAKAIILEFENELNVYAKTDLGNTYLGPKGGLQEANRLEKARRILKTLDNMRGSVFGAIGWGLAGDVGSDIGASIGSVISARAEGAIARNNNRNLHSRIYSTPDEIYTNLHSKSIGTEKRRVLDRKVKNRMKTQKQIVRNNHKPQHNTWKKTPEESEVRILNNQSNDIELKIRDRELLFREINSQMNEIISKTSNFTKNRTREGRISRMNEIKMEINEIMKGNPTIIPLFKKPKVASLLNEAYVLSQELWTSKRKAIMKMAYSSEGFLKIIRKHEKDRLIQIPSDAKDKGLMFLIQDLDTGDWVPVVIDHEIPRSINPFLWDSNNNLRITSAYENTRILENFFNKKTAPFWVINDPLSKWIVENNLFSGNLRKELLEK